MPCPHGQRTRCSTLRPPLEIGYIVACEAEEIVKVTTRANRRPPDTRVSRWRNDRTSRIVANQCVKGCARVVNAEAAVESSTSSSILPRDAWNWCARKTPGPCRTSCTSIATTQGVLSWSGIVTREPWIITRIWETMAAIFRTCTRFGDVCGTPSPELTEQLKDLPVQVYRPFQPN